MLPGTYLQKRRVADALSIEGVAAMLDTDPHLPEIDRAEWLRRIEAGTAPITDDVLAALLAANAAGRFRFDPLVLSQLICLADGHDFGHPPRLCRVCACSEWDACRDVGGGCSWVAADLCSRCARAPAQSANQARAA